jgi:hypothetical protein
MFLFKKLFLVALFCVAAPSLFAQKWMVEKPLEKWSQKEALEVLNASAWAQTYQSIQGAAAAAQSEALRQQADNNLRGSERSRTERSGGPPPVIARLHSGLPIRMALYRLNQIAANFDKMSDEQKLKFNESAKRLLECPSCQDYYVITLTQASNSSGQSVEQAIFEGMTLEEMKTIVTLRNEKGETRELAQFIAPAKRGDSAAFFFTRKDDKGNVLFTKDNSDATLMFSPAFSTSSNRFASVLPRKFDFKLSRITHNDQVVF